MDHFADFSINRGEKGRTAVLTGDWTAVAIGDAGARLDAALRSETGLALDLTKIGRCDTAGAFAIIRASEGRINPATPAAAARVKRLLELVGRALKAEPAPEQTPRSVQDMLERLGRGLVGVGHDTYETMAF